MLRAGEAAGLRWERLDLGVVTQRLQSWCTVDSHKSLGMTLQLQVVRLAASGA